MSDGISFRNGLTVVRVYANGMPVARRLNSNEISICLFKQVTVDKCTTPDYACTLCAVCILGRANL